MNLERRESMGGVVGGGEPAGAEARVIVLVESPPLRRRLCSKLATTGLLVLADDADADAAALVHDLRPELVVIELSGSPAVWAARAAALLDASSGGSVPPTWVALVDGDPLVSAAAWAAGFDEVITPPHDVQDLVARVDGLLSRRRRRGRLHLADLVVDLDGHEVYRADQRLSLTATEFRLLVALVRHRQQVLSKRQLLELVWGFDEYDTNVVEVCISVVRRKLEAVGPRLIHTIRGVGYVAREPEAVRAFTVPP